MQAAQTGSNGNALNAPLPMPCFTSGGKRAGLQTQSAAVLAGLKAPTSIHVAQGGKFNTSGSSWPQPSKDRGATVLCPLHNIFITQHSFNVKESGPWHQQQ